MHTTTYICTQYRHCASGPVVMCWCIQMPGYGKHRQLGVVYAGAVCRIYEQTFTYFFFTHSYAFAVFRYKTISISLYMQRQRLFNGICEWAHRTVNASHRHFIKYTHTCYSKRTEIFLLISLSRSLSFALSRPFFHWLFLFRLGVTYLSFSLFLSTYIENSMHSDSCFSFSEHSASYIRIHILLDIAPRCNHARTHS